MPGRTIEVAWEGRRIEAFLPDRIAGTTPELDLRAVRAAERAAAAVLRLGDREAAGFEPIARLLLRSEGLASSFIEGVNADITDVMMAQAGIDVGGAPGWVADNLAAVDEALGHRRAISSSTLRRWHRRLMRHSDLPQSVSGRFRDRQGWVGGANPLVAAYVPPPASEVGELMDDLVAFANGEDLDPITQAAVLHAQFETIHPFADGNGRIGRILIAWTLKRRLAIAVPPPVSVQFARDIGGYLSGLTLYRQERVDLWVQWFAERVERAAVTSGDVLAKLAELRAEWRERLGHLRRDSGAIALLEHLVEHPVVNSSVVAKLLDISEQAARAALAELGARGVLTEVSPTLRGRGRPARWWAATELLALLRR